MKKERAIQLLQSCIDWMMELESGRARKVIPDLLEDMGFGRDELIKVFKFNADEVNRIADSLCIPADEQTSIDETKEKSIPVLLDIGDPVYMESRGKIIQYTVNSIAIDKYGITYGVYSDQYEHHITIPENWIGERVFFTEKEAVDDAIKWAGMMKPLDIQVQSAKSQVDTQQPNQGNPAKAPER